MAAVPPTQLPEPLRLPHGSVRGGIAVVVTATYGYLLLYGQAVPQVVVNAVVVVIAFYFGSHAMSTAPPKPGEPGQPPPRKPRLVRVLLLLGFLGLTAWFLRHGLSLAAIPPELQAVLEVLGGYVAGAVASWIVHRRAHTTMMRHRLATLFRDGTALGAIVLTGYICFALVRPDVNVFGSRVGDALSLVLTFYFGSRVIGH